MDTENFLTYLFLKNFKKRKLTGIDDTIITFLTESMQKSLFIQETLQAKLKSSNVKGMAGFGKFNDLIFIREGRDSGLGH